MKATKRGGRSSLRLLMLVVAAGLVVASAAPALAAEDEAGPVATSADVVAGGGSAPVIECAWALPDGNPNIAGYQTPTNVDGDDSPQDAVAGAGSPSAIPCYRDAANVNARPTQSEGATKMIQIRPYAHDANATGGLEAGPINTNPVTPACASFADPNYPSACGAGRVIRTFIAVDKPTVGNNTINSVSIDVNHPDGTPKFQVYATPVPCNDTQIVSGSAMWSAAQATGEVSSDAINNVTRGMIALCNQGSKVIYSVDWPISKEQMCGEYNVTARASSSGGQDTLAFKLDVLCFIHLEIDFNVVDFGQLNLDGNKSIDGNLVWGDNIATVRNTGNSGMQVGVRWTKMSFTNAQGQTKYINQFDAGLAKNPVASVEHIDVTVPLASPTAEGWFSATNPNSVLCANDKAKLDLSVHVPTDVDFGHYTGTLWVLGASARGPQGPCPGDTLPGIFSDDDPNGSLSAPLTAG